MTIHTTLLDLYRKFGYPATGGICHGFSLCWIESCLQDKGSRFDRRINDIISDKQFIVSIDNVKQ